jgi:hemoglobin
MVLERFYVAAFSDELIGPFFTDVAELDLHAHLPVITDFWESILFGTVRYQGSVMQKHLSLDNKQRMTREHFDRWLALFNQTIRAEFDGPKADEMLDRARIIALTMGYKLEARHQ